MSAKITAALTALDGSKVHLGGLYINFGADMRTLIVYS